MNKIIVIVTMAIPGSGKSSIANQLSKICQGKEIELKVISSDKIREKIMKKFRKQNPGMTDENIYANTKKQGLTAYKTAIEA